MNPDLSLVLPVYNEEVILKENLRQVLQDLERNGQDFEIILVDDGSRDHSRLIAEEMARTDPRLKVVLLGKNQGKGRALKTGILESKGRVVFFSDMDLSVSIDHLPKFQQPLQDGFDLAIGSRKAPGAEILVHQPSGREFLGKGFTTLACLILGLKVSDFTCGFKAFKGEVAQDLFSRMTLADWSFDAELLFLAHRLGYRTIEIPVVWRNRKDTRVRLKQDIIKSLCGLFKIRWRHRNLFRVS